MEAGMFSGTGADLLWAIVVTGAWIGLLCVVVRTLRRLFPDEKPDTVTGPDSTTGVLTPAGTQSGSPQETSTPAWPRTLN
jgi:hypothetical protein